MEKNCNTCTYVYEKLKQQEETIAQLVLIIGTTNQKVIELQKRQIGVDPPLLREPHQVFSQAT